MGTRQGGNRAVLLQNVPGTRWLLCWSQQGFQRHSLALCPLGDICGMGVPGLLLPVDTFPEVISGEEV